MKISNQVEKAFKAPLRLEIISGELFGELSLAIAQGREIQGGIILLGVVFP